MSHFPKNLLPQNPRFLQNLMNDVFYESQKVQLQHFWDQSNVSCIMIWKAKSLFSFMCSVTCGKMNRQWSQDADFWISSPKDRFWVFVLSLIFWEYKAGIKVLTKKDVVWMNLSVFSLLLASNYHLHFLHLQKETSIKLFLITLDYHIPLVLCLSKHPSSFLLSKNRHLITFFPLLRVLLP